MISQEEAAEIVKTATAKETEASASLVYLICTLGHEIPEPEDIPVYTKALSIETVRAISEMTK